MKLEIDAALDRSALNVQAVHLNLTAVDHEIMLARSEELSIERNFDLDHLGPIQGQAIRGAELIKGWGHASETAGFLVKEALLEDLLVATGEPHDLLARILEPGPDQGDHGLAARGAATGPHRGEPHGGEKQRCALVQENGREKPPLDVGLHQPGQILQRLVLLAQIPKAPAHDFPIFSERHIIVIPAGNMLKFGQFLVHNIPNLRVLPFQEHGLAPRVPIPKPQLPLYIDAEGIQIASLRKRHRVAEPGGHLDDPRHVALLVVEPDRIQVELGAFFLLEGGKGDLHGAELVLLGLQPELPQTALAPGEQFSVLGDRQGVEGAAGDRHHFLVREEIDELRGRGGLHVLGQPELALEAPAPGVHVAEGRERQRVVLAAGDLHHEAVPQRGDRLREGQEGGAPLAQRAVVAPPVGEDLALVVQEEHRPLAGQ